MTQPDFLVLGAPKCGTTSLYYYLKQHPELFLSPKETHYFVCEDEGYTHVTTRSWEAYQALFSDAPDGSVTGEVAVRYLYSAKARQQIRDRLPDARLLVLLRNPVDRAFSQFLMRFRTGGSKGGEGRTLPNEQDIREAFTGFKGSHIAWSRYGKALKPWYEIFPPEQIGLFLLEDLEAAPAETMQRVLQFLGVSPDHPIDTSQQFNVSSVADYNPLLVKLKQIQWIRRMRTNHAMRRFVNRVLPRRVVEKLVWREKSGAPRIQEQVKLPDDLRQSLGQFFLEDIALLEDLSGLDFTCWKTSNSIPASGTDTLVSLEPEAR